MRKINAKQTTLFSVIILVILILTAATVWGMDQVSLGEWRVIVLVATGVTSWFLYAILMYRLFLKSTPLSVEEVSPDSRQEFAFNVNTLFHLIFFRMLMKHAFFPVPIYSLLYRMLGARIGMNSFCTGYIMDPCLTEMGNNSLIGDDALVMAHAIQGSDIILERVRIGDHVTVGARAVVFPGVTIDDHAVIATGAVVTRGTHIRAHEMWGGNPAKRWS